MGRRLSFEFSQNSSYPGIARFLINHDLIVMTGPHILIRENDIDVSRVLASFGEYFVFVFDKLVNSQILAGYYPYT